MRYLATQPGSYNTATGFQTLLNNTIGTFNTAIGRDALNSNTAGSSNTAVGVEALISNTTGNSNTAIGVVALLNNNGDNNIAVGNSAGSNLTTATTTSISATPVLPPSPARSALALEELTRPPLSPASLAWR
jgi:hypothetical protein